VDLVTCQALDTAVPDTTERLFTTTAVGYPMGRHAKATTPMNRMIAATLAQDYPGTPRSGGWSFGRRSRSGCGRGPAWWRCRLSSSVCGPCSPPRGLIDQGLRERRTGAESVRGVLGQCCLKHLVEACTVGATVTQVGRGRVEVSANDNRWIGVWEQLQAGQRVLIGASVQRIAHELFGRGISHCAHGHVGCGDATDVID
jgi:hypothetical protein